MRGSYSAPVCATPQPAPGRPAFLESHRARAEFLAGVREFFRVRGVLEVETKLLNPWGAFEAHLDSFAAERRGLRKSPQAPPTTHSRAGYLVTSPEYNLKILLADLRTDLMQIAHCFREGDVGDLHSEEFLMLEWYLIERDEFALMDQCEELLRELAAADFARPSEPLEPAPFVRVSVRELLSRRVGLADWDRASLERRVQELKLLGPGERADELAYDDLFFRSS